MGLDDFKTSSSTSTTSSSSTSSTPKTTSSSKPDEIRPWFSAVIKKEDEVVETFYKKMAFHKGGRHLDEKFLACIETEEEFERINGRCEELHDCTIEELFKNSPLKAADFVDRLDPDNPQGQEIECEICGETILVTKDKYTKVDGYVIHANHRVDEVADELELGV